LTLTRQREVVKRIAHGICKPATGWLTGILIITHPPFTFSSISFAQERKCGARLGVLKLGTPNAPLKEKKKDVFYAPNPVI
jgi:hypothetical protein